MTSSQQPPRPSYDPEDPATYQRLGVPVPVLLRIRELQAYKDWVEDGGLDRFATAYGVRPDFIYHLSDTKPAVVWAFYMELEAVPGLETIMKPTSRADMACMPISTALQLIQETENGWSSEEEADNEDNKGRTEIEEELQGSEEEGVEAVTLDQHKDVSCKTQS